VPKLTTEQREAIMDEVEAVMMSGKWSGRASHQLAERHGVTRRTIQNYRKRIEKRWTDASKVQDLEAERAGWLARVRNAQNKCLGAKEYRNLASFLAMEARVLGIEAATKLEVAHTGAVEVEHKHELLTDAELDAEIAALEAAAPPAQIIELKEVASGVHEPVEV
jgi:hypothetical protein